MVIVIYWVLLGLLLLLFCVVGAMVDTYVSYQYCRPKKKPPKWLSDHMPVWWLIIYTGLLPFWMIFLASGFQLWVIKVYVVFMLLGTVVWDFIFSKIWSGKWISDSCTKWFWVKIGKKTINIGFDEKQIVWFHIARLILVAILFIILF